MNDIEITAANEASFSDWGLKPQILKRLSEMSIVEPTEVQKRCWKPILEGRDLLVQSRTGTGKTLAFALPLLHKSQGGYGSAEVLVVLPTRELAMQVAQSWEALGAEVALLYGGSGYAEQLDKLNKGVRIVVGTPGRICDHIARGSLRLDECQTLVLDEADEILDMGFAEEVDRVLEALPVSRQTLLFSATLHENMEELAAKTLRSPKRVSVSTGLAAAIDIAHYVYEVERDYKQDALCNIIQVENPSSALIFCHTKAEADELSERLRGDGIQAACLHGDMSQAERTRTLNAFRRGHLRFLVATDVAARGLDIRGITHVINLSVPREAETYIHRVGRTGRAGSAGIAITLVSPRDMAKFKAIAKALKIAIQIRPVPQRSDVRRMVREAFHSGICRLAECGVDPAFQVLAQELLDYIEPAEIVAILLSCSPQAKACINAGFDIPLPRQKKKKLSPEELKAEHKRQRMQDTAYNLARLGRAFLQINVGRSDGDIDEEKLLQLLVAVTGKRRQSFGRINMRRHTADFETPLEEAEKIARLLTGIHWEGKTLKVRIVSDGGGQDAAADTSGEPSGARKHAAARSVWFKSQRGQSQRGGHRSKSRSAALDKRRHNDPKNHKRR
ncbi:DEAD/DEAH box helicase [bacterium]|nr:DEAD/DEAH box helicase [bacterium]